MVNVRVAGVGSVLPEGSIARTSKRVSTPGGGEAYVAGEVHGAKSAVPNRHSKVEPAWPALKVNCTAVPLATVPDGPEPIVVCGGAESSV